MSNSANLSTTPKTTKNHSFIQEIKKDNPIKTKKSLSRIKSSKLITKKEEKSKLEKYNFQSPINYNIQKLNRSPSLTYIKKFNIQDSLNKGIIKNKNKGKIFKNLKNDLTPIKVAKNKKVNLASSDSKHENKNINKKISKSREKTPIKEKSNKNDISLFSSLNYKDENKKDPLYIPHIVISPLDIFQQNIKLVIDVTSDEIDNICNSFSTFDINMEKQIYQIYENYTKNLLELYRKKEQKLKDIYNKYNRSLYAIKKKNEDKNDLNFNEIINKKQKDIEEAKLEFNLEKNLLKNELEININCIKDKEKLELDNILDNKLTDKIKKKLYDIIDSN